jgi:hypothetical protein
MITHRNTASHHILPLLPDTTDQKSRVKGREEKRIGRKESNEVVLEAGLKRRFVSCCVVLIRMRDDSEYNERRCKEATTTYLRTY